MDNTHKEFRSHALKRLGNLIRIEQREIFSVYFYAIFSGLIALSLPVGIQAIVGLLFGGSISTSIVVLIIFVVLGVLAGGVLMVFQRRVTERIQQRIFTRLSFEFAFRLPKIELSSVDNYYLPELVNRFFDISTLQKSFSKVLLEIPAATIQILFGLILIAFYHPSFIFFDIILIGLLTIIVYFTGPRGLRTSLEESHYKYKLANWLEEMARTIKSLKFAGHTPLPLETTDSITSDYLEARSSHFRILMFQYYSIIAFKVVITAGLLIVGSVLLINQQINIGQFIAAEIVILTILNSVEKLIGSLEEVYDLLTSLEKLGIVMEKPLERQGGLKFSELNIDNKNGMEVELKDLTFSYNDAGKAALKNLSMKINAGEHICVAGAEGSGKTTLIRMLAGGFPDFSGNILIAGVPLGNLNLEDYRNHLGVVTQNDSLFEGTLIDNLTMGKPEITPSMVLQEIEKLGLGDYLAGLKYGLNSELDPQGKKLPEGIVRKLVLVRNLLQRPRLLLMEDVFSNMEQKQRKELLDRVFEVQTNNSLIIVSNQEEIALRSHRVVIMKDGEIEAEGKPEELRNTLAYQRAFGKF